MTRRMQHYDVPAWQPWLILSGIGVIVLACSAAMQVIQLYVSIKTRDQRRDLTGDPWQGRSLEWSTPSPPPAFNFAVLPNVEGEEPYWRIKVRAIETQALAEEPDYQAIHMPRNSPTGFVCAFFATITGFALIWDIWWMAGFGLLASFVTFVVFAWRDRDEYEVPAEEVARVDRARRAARAAWLRDNAARRLRELT
jgi:cytochrome o ubiquinol oxidase subunit 1